MSTVRINPRIVAAPSRPRPAVVPDASGAFTMEGVFPGKYRLNASVSAARPGQPATARPPGLPPASGAAMLASTGWSVLSATAGGQDAWARTFEVRGNRPIGDAVITLTNQPAEISGKLIDRDGRPVTGMTVVLFPVDRALWGSSRINRTSDPAPTLYRPSTTPGDSPSPC
jgi:hypothetical protein